MTSEEKNNIKSKIEKYENLNQGGFMKILPRDDDPLNYDEIIDSAKALSDEFCGLTKKYSKV